MMDSRNFQEMAKKGLAKLRLSATLASSKATASPHTQNRQGALLPKQSLKSHQARISLGDKNHRRTSLKEVNQLDDRTKDHSTFGISQ